MRQEATGALAALTRDAFHEKRYTWTVPPRRQVNYPRELYDATRIIPLIGKIPRDKGWYGKGRPWSEASKAPMVERWGCVMGDGMLALDVDPGGEASLVAMPPLPATLEARTPRGGRHLIFRGRARTMVSVLPKIDVRGERGQIAVEPTPGYQWVNDLPIAEAPAWLLPENSLASNISLCPDQPLLRPKPR